MKMAGISWLALFVSTLITGCSCSLPVTTIETTLKDLTENGLGVSKMQEHLNSKGSFSSTMIDGEAIANTLAASLSVKLVQRNALVKGLGTMIENEYTNFESSTSFLECCSVKNIAADYDSRFRSEVDITSMCLRVSENANDTVKHLNSKVLEQFTLNMETVNGIKWQYFGSVDGVLYGYPSSTTSDCDSYDPRLRPWYSAAMSLTKNLIVVLDASHGMSSCVLQGKPCLSIAMEMMEILFGTLTSTDHIGLVTFDKVYTIPEEINGDSCFGDGLATATSANKEAIINHVKNLPVGEAEKGKYSQGIKGAGSYFKKDNFAGSNIVVFISGVENEDNSPTVSSAITDLSVKDPIFVAYSIGKPSKVQANVLNMMPAVAFAGSYSEIIRREDIRKKMGLFYKSIASPLTEPVMTGPYFDAFGLGVITTVCMPVFISDQFQGVVGIDVTLSDIFADALGFERSDSYAFVVDRNTGLTLTHPLLPRPAEISSAFVNLRLDMLEPGEEVQKVISMIREGESGSDNIMADIVRSKGVTRREGVTVTNSNLTYTYKEVPGTPFSVGVVTSYEDDVSVYAMNPDIAAADIAFTYHETQFDTTQKFCKQFFRKAIQTSTTVKLAAQSFTDPFAYLDGAEKAEDVQLYDDIIRGKSSNTKFTSGVIETIKLTSLLDTIWTDENTGSASYAGWRYVGTERGVVRIFPGLTLNKNYDPTTRSWYKRSVDKPDHITVSSPYLDAFGAGYVVTVSKAILETGGMKLFGVMAVDLAVHYFHESMIHAVEGCSSQSERCFLMDSSGYIVTHPTWFDNTWSTAPTFENVHIANLEWDIGSDMMKRQYLVKSKCVNMFDSIEQQFYQMSADSGSHLDAEPFYEFSLVPNTNMYLVKQDLSKANPTVDRDAVCNCTGSDSTGANQCPKGTTTSCECPCFSQLDMYRCTGVMKRFDYVSCTPEEPTKSVNSDVGEDDLIGLENCFNHDCATKIDASSCDSFSSCRFCEKDSKGAAITPYCGHYAECYYGRVDYENPYDALESKGNVLTYTRSVMPLAIIILVLLI